MEKAHTVSFILNDKNYHGAYMQHLLHRRRGWMLVRSIACLLCVCLGAYFLTLTSQRPLGYIFVAGGTLGLLRPMIWQVWHERMVRRNAAYGTRISYVFSKQGVEIKGEQGDFEIAWDKLVDLAITKKGLLLYPNKKSYLWIPKAAFKKLSMHEATACFNRGE